VIPNSWRVYEGPLFTLLAAANLILLGINRWLVVWFAGEQEAGYFTLAGNAVAIITSMLATMLMQYVQPDLFALGDRGTDHRPALARRMDQVALFYTIIGLVGIALLSALAPRLVGPLISEEYLPALTWIFPAGCFGLTVSLGLFYHTMLLAGRRERACAPVDLTAAAILIVGCTVTASAGTDWLARWLIVTPLVPWLLSRTLARHHLFKPDANQVPAQAR
jgi:O-antigen/teichoic acid export membrane protein